MGKIEGEKLTIVKAFKNSFYIVPDYQREYVWTEKEVTLLLEDINQAFQEDQQQNKSEYFIGTMLVAPIEDYEDTFGIIDGQQRLTTMFLIICALRSFFKNKDEYNSMKNNLTEDYYDDNNELKIKPKLDTQYENSITVIKKIVDNDNSPDEIKKDIEGSDIEIYGSIKKLLEAYEIIYQFIEEKYNYENILKQYWQYFRLNVVFIQISTDISNSFKIFETINERGIGLNPMDLLKNLLFTHIKNKDFTKLKDKWKAITRLLEKNNEKPLRFLRYFIMSNYEIKNKNGNAIIQENKIYEWFLKDKTIEFTEYKRKPFKFVEKIFKNAQFYIDLIKGLGNDGKVNEAITSLNKLTQNKSSLHYILLLSVSKLPKQLFDHFVLQLENLLFYSIFTKTADKRMLENDFSLWSDKLKKIVEIKDQTEQINELNTFISNHFAKYIETKKQELEDALKRLILKSRQKQQIKYFLAKITQYLDIAFRGKQNPISLEHYFQLEIEHILPNKPNKELKNDWNEKNKTLEYEKFKDKVGNLTLLEEALNKIAGNNFYQEKKSKYKETANYLTKSLSGITNVGKNSSINKINEDLIEFGDTWGAKEI